MNSSQVRFAAVGAAGALAAIGAVAFAGASSAATGVATLEGAAAQAPARHAQAAVERSGVHVTAAPGSCTHVSDGSLSAVVTFRPQTMSGPATYRVQMLDASDQRPVQTRAIRIGSAAPSTIDVVWQQRSHDPGAVNLRILDAHGTQVAAVHERTGGPLVAARCGA